MKLALILLSTLIFVQPVQEKPQPAPPKAQKTIYSGRLPNNFRKLGLLFKQKQAIYKIQSDYQKKIEELQKQIDQLELDRDKKIYDSLTDRQKEYLKELLKEKAEEDLNILDEK